jgi:hypothetical protein
LELEIFIYEFYEYDEPNGNSMSSLPVSVVWAEVSAKSRKIDSQSFEAVQRFYYKSRFRGN